MQYVFWSTRANNLNGEESPDCCLFSDERPPHSDPRANLSKTCILVSRCSNIICEAKPPAGKFGENSDTCAPVNLIPKINCEKGSTSDVTVEETRPLPGVVLSYSKPCHMTYGSLTQAGTKTRLLTLLIFNHLIISKANLSMYITLIYIN